MVLQVASFAHLGSTLILDEGSNIVDQAEHHRQARDYESYCEHHFQNLYADLDQFVHIN
jgi:hypothetical protein